MGASIARAQARSGAERRDRRVEPAGHALVISQVEERRHVHRIAADGGLLERQRLVEAAEETGQRGARGQHTQVCRSIASARSKCRRGTGEVVVAVHRDRADRRGPAPCSGSIASALHGRLAGLGESCLARQQALARLVAEVAGQPGPRRDVARIDRQHLAVKRVGLLERLGGERPSEPDSLR